MTLTEFLLTRIAEDEAAAREPQWLAFEYGVDNEGRNRFAARVLAECEAKRDIVSLALIADNGGLHADAWTIMKSALRDLAAVYADHPDYRPEWRRELRP